MFGEWRTSAKDYVSTARLYNSEIGSMQGAAIQDWMCEPVMIKKTGLTIREHQLRTVASYRQLRSLAPDVPWFPVLQGWELDDYKRHIDDYGKGDDGIDLGTLPRVGLGSVCRRQHSDEIAEIVVTLERLGLKLHGFGVKLKGLEKISNHLVSADSMAWSFDARRKPPLTGHHHKNCANCQTYAELWYRNRVWPLIQFNKTKYELQEDYQRGLFTDQQIAPAENEGLIEVLNMVA